MNVDAKEFVPYSDWKSYKHECQCIEFVPCSDWKSYKNLYIYKYVQKILSLRYYEYHKDILADRCVIRRHAIHGSNVGVRLYSTYS